MALVRLSCRKCKTSKSSLIQYRGFGSTQFECISCNNKKTSRTLSPLTSISCQNCSFIGPLLNGRCETCRSKKNPNPLSNISSLIDGPMPSAWTSTYGFSKSNSPLETTQISFSADNVYEDSYSPSSRHSDSPIENSNLEKLCKSCNKSSANRWVRDKQSDGHFCYNCYQKRNRSGAFVDLLKDGTTRQRKCTSCACILPQDGIKIVMAIH
jgi:hypothetical protein